MGNENKRILRFFSTCYGLLSEANTTGSFNSHLPSHNIASSCAYNSQVQESCCHKDRELTKWAFFFFVISKWSVRGRGPLCPW